MILNIKDGNYSNDNHGSSATFLWKFHNSSDLDSFFNCQHGDVMTSSKFEINGCVFYFELTPNGWSSLVSINECALWLAVDSLPHKVYDVGIIYHVNCTQIGYKEKERQYLTIPQHGMYSITTMPFIKRERMVNLKKFQFELFVHVFATRDEEGNHLDCDGNIIESTLEEIVSDADDADGDGKEDGGLSLLSKSTNIRNVLRKIKSKLRKIFK